MSKQRVIAE